MKLTRIRIPRPSAIEIARVARYVEREGVSFTVEASISAGLVRLEGARGEEEEEDDRRDDVEKPTCVHDSPGEIIHVLEDVQVAQRLARLGEGQKVPRHSDDEAPEDENERQDRGDDLVLRQRGRERPG